MRTTSTRAIENILSICPIEVQVKYEAALAATRLMVMGEWIAEGHGTRYHKIVDILREGNVTTESCDTIPQKYMRAECITRTPERGEECMRIVSLANDSGTDLYTDGSKRKERTGMGFYDIGRGMGKCFRLPDHNTILQAEIVAITEGIRWLKELDNIGPIRIFTDSKFVVKLLENEVVKSRNVLECKKEINSYGTRGNVEIIWIPSHSGITGNERADELSKMGLSLDNVNMANTKPFLRFKEDLKKWAQNEHVRQWHAADVGKITDILWGDPNITKTHEILKLNRSSLRRLVNILTGHAELRYHLARMRLSDNATCRACEEEEETIEHFLCHCPAFGRIRKRHFLRDSIPELEHLRGINWKTIRCYVEETGLLSH